MQIRSLVLLEVTMEKLENIPAWLPCILAFVSLIMDIGFLWASIFCGEVYVYVFGSLWTCTIIVDLLFLLAFYNKDHVAIRCGAALKIVCAVTVMIGAMVLGGRLYIMVSHISITTKY